MKHFIIEIIYNAPIEQIEAVVASHRLFLKAGYATGLLLCSGPQVPRLGGWVIARALSRSEIAEYFAQDPYRLAGVAEHKIHEFEPVLQQDFLAGWIAGEKSS